MRTIFFLITLVVIAGCSEDTALKTAGAKSHALESAPVEAQPERTEAVAADSKPKWMMEVEGMPTLSGTVVMTSKIGVTKYALLGSEALVFFDIMNAADTEPYIANIGFPRAQINCVYRSDNHQTSSGLRLSIDGERYNVEGEITCAGRDAEGTSHSVSGYFTPK